MNITVIHGDDKALAYNRLRELIRLYKKRNYEVRKYSALSKTSFKEALASQGLFLDHVTLVENPGLISKKDLNYLSSLKDPGEVILYSEGFLLKALLDLLPKGTRIEEFKLPKLTYKFLDSFYPGNSASAITLLHKISAKEPDELILYLLSKHVRDLYWVSLENSSLNYPDWRILKLQNQAGKFKKGLLKNIIGELAEIDVRIKTSKESLIPSLDLLIVTLLE